MAHNVHNNEVTIEKEVGYEESATGGNSNSNMQCPMVYGKAEAVLGKELILYV